MTDDAPIWFRCPTCDRTIAVDSQMRSTVIANGCVLCGAPVDDDAFTTPG